MKGQQYMHGLVPRLLIAGLAFGKDTGVLPGVTMDIFSFVFACGLVRVLVGI
jgi:hypothetical protein